MPGRPLAIAVAVLLLLLSPAAPALEPEPHADPFVELPDVELPSARHACAQEHAFQVLYVLPPATLDQYAARVPLIRGGIAAATGIVLESALPHGYDARLRFVCDADGEVSVPWVRVPTAPTATSFSTIVRDLRAQGYDDERLKYWVLFEGMNFVCGCSGQAQGYHDDRLAEDNRNNVGNMFAMTFVGNYGPIKAPTATFTNVMLHEASHTMGAVQLSAPHSTGGFHCNDGMDVLCYADGAPSSQFTPTACPRLTVTWVGPEMPYDCGSDDYFHPAPPPGSYLAHHWNLASPLNRWIDSTPLT